jgi:hypothetical protein
MLAKNIYFFVIYFTIETCKDYKYIPFFYKSLYRPTTIREIVFYNCSFPSRDEYGWGGAFEYLPGKKNILADAFILPGHQRTDNSSNNTPLRIRKQQYRISNVYCPDIQ